MIQLARGAELLHVPAIQNRNAVGQRHRLYLIMGDKDGGGLQPVLQLADIDPHLTAQLCVQIAKRFVHQEHRRIAHDRAPHGNPLTLTARQGPWPPVQQILDAQNGGGLFRRVLALGLADPAQFQAKADVFRNRHMRVKRVVLEHHRNVAVLGRHVIDLGVANEKVAAGWGFKTGDHPQQGRFPAPRRADEHHQFAIPDIKINALDNLHLAE